MHNNSKVGAAQGIVEVKSHSTASKFWWGMSLFPLLTSGIMLGDGSPKEKIVWVIALLVTPIIIRIIDVVEKRYRRAHQID